MITDALSRREWLRWTGALAAGWVARDVQLPHSEPELVIGLGEFGARAQKEIQKQFLHSEFWVFHDGLVPLAALGHARAGEIDREVIVGARANILVPAAISEHVRLMPERVCESMIVVDLRDEFSAAVLPSVAEQIEDRATRVEIRYRVGTTAHPLQCQRVRRVLAEAAGVKASWRLT